MGDLFDPKIMQDFKLELRPLHCGGVWIVYYIPLYDNKDWTFTKFATYIH